MKLKSVIIATLFLLFAAAAQAEVAISASHRLVEATDNASNTQVIIDVTVSNNGESISHLTLIAKELFFADGQPMVFDMGTLDAGESRVLQIDTISNYSASFFQQGQMFSLYGSAVSVSGITEVSLTTDEEK